MNTREATHPTVTGIGHLIRKCLCPSMCVHLATSGIFVYTGVTVDNSHQVGYPSHRDDSHRASATYMSLAGTHRVFCSDHDLVKPLVNIYIRGMYPLRRWYGEHAITIQGSIAERVVRNSPTMPFSPVALCPDSYACVFPWWPLIM